VVQRDPTGSGIVDTDIVKQGWVPAGCLLETNVPVASAIAEATAAKNGSTSESSPDTVVSKTPILPLSIISTSFPGIALMDYSKKGDEELDLVKDDALRVFKRYNHWSYVSRVISSSIWLQAQLPSTGCQRSGWRSWMGTGMIAFHSFPSSP
jgi:protein STE50